VTSDLVDEEAAADILNRDGRDTWEIGNRQGLEEGKPVELWGL